MREQKKRVRLDTDKSERELGMWKSPVFTVMIEEEETWVMWWWRCGSRLKDRREMNVVALDNLAKQNSGRGSSKSGSLP